MEQEVGPGHHRNLYYAQVVKLSELQTSFLLHIAEGYYFF